MAQANNTKQVEELPLLPDPKEVRKQRIAEAKKRMKALDPQPANVSQQMRAYAAMGLSIGEIAEATGKIYQHVRNVLKQPVSKKQEAVKAAEKQERDAVAHS